ncbi:MAG: hypothetical protein VB957_04965 [Pseudomonadales bacterium]|jgi:hypothetical protein
MNYLEQSQYAENESTGHSSIHPVFIEVLKQSLPDELALGLEARKIASVVSQILVRREENVHVIYLPAGKGRVAFGGKLLT